MTSGGNELHPNAQALLEADAAFSRGDLDAFGSFLADDVVWHWPGRHRASGTHRGRDQVLALMRRGKEATEGTLTVEPVDILASDKHVFAFSRVKGEREGKTLDAIRAVCYVMNENHQATEMFTLLGDQSAEDEFFS
jgi:ketosteroid isomerase-like protein